MFKSFLKIVSVPTLLLGSSYLEQEYGVSETIKETYGRVSYVTDSLNLTNYKRELFNQYYSNNCGDVTKSLVCKSVKPDGPMETYSVVDPDSIFQSKSSKLEDVYFSKLEGIRNNAGMREAARLILGNLEQNQNELVLHYPFVGSHVAFLDMLLEFSKSDNVKTVKFILSDDSRFLSQLNEVLIANIKSVLTSNDITDYQIDGNVITFSFKTLSVKLEIVNQNLTKDKLESDVCIVHDPGAFEGGSAFREVCSSNIAITSKDRMKNGGIGFSGKQYDMIEGAEQFDHGHCIYSIKGGQVFTPEDLVDSNRLVYVKFR